MASGTAPIPNWEVQTLNQLEQKGLLSGIPASALAGMAINESGGEVKGPGVASTGDGGYFGSNASWYTGGRNQLKIASSKSFVLQAETTAQKLAGYGSSAGTLGDIAIFNIGGGPASEGGSAGGTLWQNSADAVDASQLPSTLTGGTAPVGYSLLNQPAGSSIGSDISQFLAGGEAAITQPGAGIGQLYNWATGSGNGSSGSSGSGSSSSSSSSGGLLAKVGGFLLGAALILVGVVILFKNNAPPAAEDAAAAAAA